MKRGLVHKSIINAAIIIKYSHTNSWSCQYKMKVAIIGPDLSRSCWKVVHVLYLIAIFSESFYTKMQFPVFYSIQSRAFSEIGPRRKMFCFLLFPLLDLASQAFASCSSQVTFKVTKSGITNYPKKATAFGVPLLASSKWTDAQVNHAASVLAKYIDNNEDGCPGNLEVF